VVLENQGSVAVTDEFWVDVYVHPDVAPTCVNQTWPMLGSQGLVWGVTADVLPNLVPGGTITLTVGDASYFADLSQVTWPLSAGTPVYAQVDSASASTAYGAVLETHELRGGAYNNIAGGVSTAVVLGQATPPAEGEEPFGAAGLPERP